MKLDYFTRDHADYPHVVKIRPEPSVKLLEWRNNHEKACEWLKTNMPLRKRKPKRWTQGILGFHFRDKNDAMYFKLVMS